jgi:hypothetical protein
MAEEQNNRIGFSVDVTTGKSEENLDGVVQKISEVKAEIGNLKKQTKDADEIKLAQLNASIQDLQRQLTKLNSVYSGWIQNATNIDTKPIGNVKKQLQELQDVLTKWDGQAATFRKDVASRFLIPNSAVDQAKLYKEIMQQIQGLARDGNVGQFKATQAIDFFNTRLVNAQKQADVLTAKINELKKTANGLNTVEGFKKWTAAGGGAFLEESMLDVWDGKLDDRIKKLKNINKELQALKKEQVGFTGSNSEFASLKNLAMEDVSGLVIYLKRQLDALNATYKETTKTAKQSAKDVIEAWGGKGSFVDSLGDLESWRKALREYTSLRDQLKYTIDNSTVSDKTSLDLYKKALDELNASIIKAKAALHGESDTSKASQTKTSAPKEPKVSYVGAFKKWSGEGSFVDQFDYNGWSDKINQLKKMRDQLDYAFSKSEDTATLKKYRAAIDEITAALAKARAEQSKYNSEIKKQTQEAKQATDTTTQGIEKQISEYAKLKQRLEDIQEKIKSNYISNYGKNDDLYAKNLASLRREYKELSKTLNNAERQMESVAFKSDFLGNSFDRLYRRAGWILSNLFVGGIFGAGEVMFQNMVTMESSMAQFSQVMATNAHSVNAFGQALGDLNWERLAQGLDTSMSQTIAFRRDLEMMKDSLVDLAVKYGEASQDVITSATLWGRKYKDNATILTMTDAAMKLAVADSFSITEANKNLESSIVQWGFQIRNNNDAMIVSNKIIDSWTALAHKMALSAQDLSAANQRAAQSMNAVGLSFDEGQALIASALANTQQAGGEIGNAIKSIMGSIHSDKAIKEIQSLGIEMYKTGENGKREFRDVGEVMIDLMLKTQGTKENLEDLLKDISGGKRSHLPQPLVIAA